eukprot:m.21431 g.21431  ORF g.21431 m.21431 type:complete len:539 (-) comp12694_c0_seq1:32-1648(-)
MMYCSRVYLFTVAMLKLVLCLLVCAVAASRQGSVTLFPQPTFHSQVVPNAAATGSFSPGSEHPSGFGVLKIETQPQFNNTEQYFAAGYLEGQLTQKEIFDMYTNMLSVEPVYKSPPKNLTDFLDTQFKWVRAQVTERSSDVYWQNVGYIMAQFDGLVAGYGDKAPESEKLSLFAFYYLNGMGDFFDLLPATCPEYRSDFESMTMDELKEYRFKTGHCSALVKLDPGFEDLFMGHSSWFRYSAMLRIYKHYSFQTSDGGSKVSFSSYPAFLVSLDDFYITGKGLVILQTTNNLFDTSLYDGNVVPQTLQSWLRVRVACALAKDGETWSKHASYLGCSYLNQYMTIDLKRFVPKQPLQKGLLWVMELIPGTAVYEDRTDILERGYWPSYNVPSFTEIYNKSGYPEMIKKYGSEISYDLCVRAKIFRRDQGKVADISSFKDILRYNEYQTDPYSNGNPEDSICARGDLSGGDHNSKSAGGCYDTKVTNFADALKMRSEAINGPTVGTGNLPPFKWSQFPLDSHLGMPNVFNNTFEVQDPQW